MLLMESRREECRLWYGGSSHCHSSGRSRAGTQGSFLWEVAKNIESHWSRGWTGQDQVEGPVCVCVLKAERP